MGRLRPHTYSLTLNQIFASLSMMNRLSSKNNMFKFKTSKNLPIILEESIEYTSNA